jgi:PleD family two-component response regulator
VASALRGFLEGAYEVRAARSEDEVLEAVSSFEADLVVASESDRFDAEGVCAALKARDPSLPVILVYAPEEKDPDGRAMRAGAEACLQGPLKQGAVLSCVRNVLTLTELRARNVEAAARASPQATAAAASGPTEVPDLASFKGLLIREVKRSRRYKYPVAFVVVAYDAFATGMPALETTDIGVLLERARQALVGCLREQDLVSAFHPGSWVAFLPHTPTDGAVVVAERMRERLTGLERTFLTASAGLAVHAASEGRELSFGALFREATDALAQARGAGGARTVVGSSAASAPRKRNRISLA